VFYPHLLADNSRYGTSEDVSRRLRLWPLGQDGLDERDWAGQSETFIQDLKLFLSQLSPDATRTDGFGRLPTLAVADVSVRRAITNTFINFMPSYYFQPSLRLSLVWLQMILMHSRRSPCWPSQQLPPVGAFGL
jgi:hypothetical protein